MSRLIYKGNTINNFGRFLPAPYIEQIIVRDAVVEATVALFIEVPERYVDNDDYANESGLSDLAYYIFLSTVSSAAEAVVDKTMNIFLPMWLYQQNEESEYYYGETIASFGEFIQLEFSDFTDTEETLYTKAGTKLRKYQTTVELTEAAGMMQDDEDTDFWEDKYDGGTLFAFSSMLKYDELVNETDYSSLEEYVENPPLINNNMSNISYEVIFENGAIKPSTQVVWLDANKEPYDDTSLQSLTSQYHKSENITHQDIVDSIQLLLDEYEELAESPRRTNLKNVINDISYVLSVYGQEPELLPRLNLLRKTFPSKSTGSIIGKLYVRFRKRIFEANRAILQEERIFKQLIVNPKIVDSRSAIESDWSLRDRISYEDEELVYDKWYIGSEYMSSNESPGNDKIVTHGFFFFDYQKFKETCSAHRIYDLSLVENYFGDSIFNSSVYLTNATLQRIETGAMGKNVSNEMSSDIDSTPKTEDVEFTWFTEDAQNMAYSFTDDDEQDIVVYLMLRSFNLTYAHGLQDYKLMCFQFRDIYDSDYIADPDDPADDFYYKASITTEDKSSEVVKEIISQYYDKMNSFQEDYLSLAQEICSYNDFDGKFNSFFIESMKNEYSDEPSSAPWVYMPIVFNIHKDLLNNKFGGDRDSLIESSKAITAKISPFTGTLIELETFWEQIYNLYYDYYDGWDYNVEEDTEPNNTIPSLLYTADRDTTETFENNMTEIPPVYMEEWLCTSNDECYNEYGEIDLDTCSYCYRKCWDGSDGEDETGKCNSYFCLEDAHCVDKYGEGAKCVTDTYYGDGQFPAVCDTSEAEGTVLEQEYVYVYAAFPWEESGVWDEYVSRLNPDETSAPAQDYSGLMNKINNYAQDYWGYVYNSNRYYHNREDSKDNTDTVFEALINAMPGLCASGWAAVMESLYDDSIIPGTRGISVGRDAADAKQKFMQWFYPNYEGSATNVDIEEPSYDVDIEDGFDIYRTTYKPAEAKDMADVMDYLLSYEWYSQDLQDRWEIS